jgi:hypothetical protein
MISHAKRNPRNKSKIAPSSVSSISNDAKITIKELRQMLGEQIATGQGKRTSRRIIGTSPLNVEVSFEDASKMLGVDGMNIGTYTSTPKPDGSLDGYGQGAFATLEGEIVTWKGIGVGRFGAAGAVSYRGTLSYSTTSAKLARLNGIAGVFEFEVDAAGNTSSKIWEWK